MGRGVQVCTWVFTINNYDEENVRMLQALQHPWVCVFGKEVGAQGTPHLQGVVWRCDDVRVERGQVERVLGGRAWCDPCRDYVSAIGYAIKDGDYYTSLPPDDHFADVYEDAKRVCSDNRWLGYTFLNHYGYPDTPCSLSDLRVYYTTFLFNN